MKRLVLLLCWVISSQVGAALISQEIAVESAQIWMDGNPIMGAVEHSVASVEMFPGTGGYSVYVVHLLPTGYLILNSDDRLPLVVSFSTESSVDLSDLPQNAFRAMLLRHVERMAKELAQPPSATPPAMEFEPLAVTELYGPFLETTWDQCNPYNKLCPDDPAGSNYYAQRAPVGCVPTAYAQILNFHRWPFFGEGSHSYTDSSGSITGAHVAVFSDQYDWDSMLSAYDVWNPNPLAAEDAVAELMYELGVAAEANYESSGTSSSIRTLGQRLGKHFFFEQSEWQSTQAALIAPMEADLRAGFPCIVSIPNHAIVVDGLMVDDGMTTYHINYGWGGSNNGWWSKDNVAGDALEDGVTSLRPRLLALPKTNSVVGVMGESVELEWLIPQRRTNEVAQLDILRLEQQAGNWQSDASEITGVNVGWDVVAAGRSGDCWFTGPNDYSSHLLGEVFVPDASTQLTFWQCARLYISLFSVEVSTDGENYDTLYSTPDNIYESNWSQQTISLAAYAGQQIRLRFVLSNSGGSYGGDWAGIRVDDLAITSGDWHDWQPFAVDDTLAYRQPVHYTLLTNLPAGTHTLAAVLTDTSAEEHGLSPTFTLTVATDDIDNDGLPNDWETQYYGGPTNANPAALASNGVNTVLDAYVAGFDPTDPWAVFGLDHLGSDAGDFSRYVLEWIAVPGRVYSVYWSTNLLDGFDALPFASNLTSGVFTDTVHSASSEGFYQLEVELAP